MVNTKQHPIESLMKTAMENIREMVEVNTVVGDPIETEEGTIIMPITKASFGFAAGGAEYGTINKDNSSNSEEKNQFNRFPFGGGSGAGVSVQPIAFMIIENGKVQIRHINYQMGTMSKLMEEVPELISKIGIYLNSKKYNSKNSKLENKDEDEKNISKVLEVYESKE